MARKWKRQDFSEKKRSPVSWNHDSRIRKHFGEFPVYRLAVSFTRAAGLTMLFSYVFYRSWLGVLAFPAMAVWCIRQDRHGYERQQRQALARQFIDMILSVAGSLQAGYSIENAFLEAEKEICSLHGRGSQMAIELAKIRHGLSNRVPIEQQLLRFGSRSQVEEIRDFTEVFAILKHSGGNMREMLRRTVELTRQRLEVEEEIARLLNSRQYEMRIMNGIPFLLYGYVQITSPGFFDVLYHNPAGFCVMTACLGGYLAAVLLSARIMDIQV